MGVRYWDGDGFGNFLLMQDEESNGEVLYWVRRDSGAEYQRASDVLSFYERVYYIREVFPAWASESPSQPSEEKDLSDVNIIREALNGERGEHQKLIAEYGVQVVATLIRKNSDYGGSAWQHPCLLQKLSGREGIQVRMSDKVQRLQKLLNGDTAQVAESTEDSMKDLVGYGILWLAAPEEAR